MKFIFLGTPRFAADILKKLISGGLLPDKVICNPDKPVGRKKIVTPPAVKLMLMNLPVELRGKIQILQPEKLNAAIFATSEKKSDVFVVAAYSKIIPKGILAIPIHGAIGIHPSLLPKYRGASPIQTAILNGDEESGVTLYLLDEKVDHGPIIAQKKLDVKDLTFENASEKLAELAGDLLIEVLPEYLAGELKLIPQSETETTYTKKFSSDDGFVGETELANAISGKDPEEAKKIGAKIRALNPEPGVWTKKVNKRMKLLEAEIKNGILVIKKIQMEGERPIVINGPATLKI